MKNRFFGLRHGQSEANVADIVVSDPAIGTVDYGLTATGRDQVAKSTATSLLDSQTVIISSDFLRARETAEIAASILECHAPRLDERLRERFFGDWDMQVNSNYERVWELDKGDAEHCEGGVESAAAVCGRLRDLIESVEREYDGKTVLFVSHGDPLQLMQTVFETRSPTEHRSLTPWGTAEIRELVGKC